MPPLEWPIVKSALLFLVLPGFGIALCVLAIAVAIAKSDNQRSIAASIGFIAAMTVGNLLNGLVPFWEFETGWRSLFWAMLVAALSESILNLAHPQAFRSRSSRIANFALAVAISLWLTSWDLMGSQPWVCGILASVILLNWTTLNSLGQLKEGHLIPLIVAVVWGGSAVMVLILSHSALFGDLAVLMSCALAGVGVVAAIAHLRLTGIYAGPSVFVPGLMLAAATNTYSDVPMASFALVAVSPGFLVLLRWKKAATWFETHRMTLVLFSLIPGIIAVGLALRAEM